MTQMMPDALESRTISIPGDGGGWMLPCPKLLG